MVILFEKLSRALDAFNAHRIESEQVEWYELIKGIEDPLDENEIMRLIIDLYEDTYDDVVVTVVPRLGRGCYYNTPQTNSTTISPFSSKVIDFTTLLINARWSSRDRFA